MIFWDKIQMEYGRMMSIWYYSIAKHKYFRTLPKRLQMIRN
nr:MAG TPA: hypothetical protein [Caudoviricetes sp.]